MQTFLVGGAVRDEVMDNVAHDFDYVVVGATVEEMLAKGFKRVGSDFPVFIHPQTGEEYALARRERKTGNGYNGFSVETDSSVSLENDLSRRDLTINAIAKNVETNEFIDPFSGIDDIRDRILRPVSDAFAEDPVRALRALRFAARFGFEFSDELCDSIQKLIDDREFEHLVNERVMKELTKTMNEAQWQKFFAISVNGVPVFNSIICQMMNSDDERIGTLAQRETIGVNGVFDLNFFSASLGVIRFNDILVFLNASNDLLLHSEMADEIEHGIKVMAKCETVDIEMVHNMIEWFGLFNQESVKFRHMKMMSSFFPELNRFICASNVAHTIRFNDIVQGGETLSETGKRLFDTRVQTIINNWKSLAD